MDEPKQRQEDEQPSNNLTMGVALGTPLGVVLSLLTDNWGMIGVGIALGIAFGAIPSSTWRTRQGESPPDREG